MTQFVITFAFSVGLEPRVDVTEKRNKKLKAHTKERKSRKSFVVDHDAVKNIIGVGQILADIHIEYELVPGFRFALDCCCWDNAAKIYMNGMTCILKPLLIEDKLWVVFSIYHLTNLNEMQMRKLFNHTLTFQVSAGKERFSEKAKNDRPRHFFIDDSSLEKNPADMFIELYPFDEDNGIPIFEKTDFPDFPDTTDNGIYNYEVPNINIHIKALPDPIHHRLFWKMIRKPLFVPEPAIIPTEQSKNTVKNVQTEKKLKLKKMEKPKTMVHELSFEAQNFFSEMTPIIRYLNTSEISGPSRIIIYSSCSDLLTDMDMRLRLNPLSINVEKLLNLPDDLLIQDGFYGVQARVHFLDREIVSPYFKPERKISMRFINSFLCEELDYMKLISALSHDVLIVQIFGIFNNSRSRLESSIFGTRVSDADISKPIDSRETYRDLQKSHEVLLGVATFDLSDLLNGYWEISATNSLFHPNTFNSIGFPSLSCDTLTRPINSNIFTTFRNKSSLTPDVLSLHSTSIRIRVRLAGSLRPAMREIFEKGEFFNRIFLILKNRTLSMEILKGVSDHNHEILNSHVSPGTSESTWNGLAEQYFKNKNEADSNSMDFTAVLTGYTIDTINEIFIFLEGPANSYLLTIWNKVMHLPLTDGRVLFQSDFIFLTRLYSKFISLGGVYTLTLDDSIEDLLKNVAFYVDGKFPEPCRRAIRTIGLEIFTSSVRSMCQTRMYPSLEALECLQEVLGGVRSLQTDLK
ncbi:uncharacterized protein LOC112495130 [Cephus cinctus]|uniref:Uncharacterized protein LOC112495130 n=1 Tax=Cephus cinctus TaxID=211228 RepID=A0AAJ7RTA8_CEPCN|nr:uncharacterized protein LOC112495130 [Cephus cinctus]XP_024946051.1 uncharacterized protein LOC112495130 [Cephus cinctus]